MRWKEGELLDVLPNSQVVHHGQGLSADTEGVVHIHGVAVDSDRIPGPQVTSHGELDSNAVGVG